MTDYRMEILTSSSKTTEIWKARVQLLRELCLARDLQIRKRIIRRSFYRLFAPYCKAYYLHQQKQRTYGICWEKIYCGETRGLVSVVLPVYNQANLVEESIESVLEQTYEDLELIIVNDGSTDGVEGLLRKYVAIPRVLILIQQNQGLPAALNSGFAHAKGEFYTWTSADNIMLPNQIEEQVRYLNKNDFVQMVYCNYELIDEAGRPFRNVPSSRSNLINTDQDIHSLNYSYNFINACFLYRSYIGRILGNYHPETYGAEDYDYWMRINNHFAIQHIGSKQSYYKYRIHSNTILEREGKARIGQIIRQTQRLDLKRQSFFQSPVIFYIPKCMQLKTMERKGLFRKPTLQIVRFETCEALDESLSCGGTSQKKALFLSTDQMKDSVYQSLLKRFEDDKLLFTFGIVKDDIGDNEINALSPLDWIIVSTKDSYQLLSSFYENRLLCLPAWKECLNLYTIIANTHLFYRHVGRKPLYPTPKHSVYQ